MASFVAAASDQVRSTWRSTARLAGPLIFVASLLALFGLAKTELLIFEVIVHVYRLAANLVYGALDHHHIVRVTSQRIPRDVITILLVSFVITAITVWSAIQTFLRNRALLRDQSAEADRRIAAALEDEDGVGGAIGGGALAGLIIAGPIGGVIGGLLGAVSGALAASRAQGVAKSAQADRARLQALVNDSGRAIFVRGVQRLAFCLFVGALLIAFNENSVWLTKKSGEMDDAIEAFLIHLTRLRIG